MTETFTAAELQYLLGRPVRARVEPRQRLEFAGKRILITGAGGSIGSELARELVSCRPAAIGLLDYAELHLFNIEREIRALAPPDVAIETFQADVTHGTAVMRACRELRPDVIYHAAACKHVTMAERAPAFAAHVNVLGTAETAAAAAEAGARFVLISSDKAADPKSVMGATKRLAELVVLAMASPQFRPVVVRFGNVIGSSGSVVQIMRECVRAGKPIPITDPGATRFFMTASEAVALVLRADLLGLASEIFWLEMGRPIRMGELAERLLDLEVTAGFPRVPVQVVGLRPGEKRIEILSDPRLTFERTIDRRIRVAREPAVPFGTLLPLIGRLRRAVARVDDASALDALMQGVQGFVPSEQARAVADRAIEQRPIPAYERLRRRRAAA